MPGEATAAVRFCRLGASQWARAVLNNVAQRFNVDPLIVEFDTCETCLPTSHKTSFSRASRTWF